MISLQNSYTTIVSVYKFINQNFAAAEIKTCVTIRIVGGTISHPKQFKLTIRN